MLATVVDGGRSYSTWFKTRALDGFRWRGRRESSRGLSLPSQGTKISGGAVGVRFCRGRRSLRVARRREVCGGSSSFAGRCLDLCLARREIPSGPWARPRAVAAAIHSGRFREGIVTRQQSWAASRTRYNKIQGTRTAAGTVAGTSYSGRTAVDEFSMGSGIEVGMTSGGRMCEVIQQLSRRKWRGARD